jgi:hypothetical protein
MAHFFVSGSATTYWIEKVRGSKKPVTSGLAVMDFPLALFRAAMTAAFASDPARKAIVSWRRSSVHLRP